MKSIIGANRRETRIEVQLPVDIHGEYAFTEDGKPVRGKQPVVLQLPRFDCMTRDQFKAINKDLAEIEKQKDDDGNDLSPQDKSYQIVVAMLRPFVGEDELKVIQGLHLFELEQIAETVQEASTISVGELLASTNS